MKMWLENEKKTCTASEDFKSNIEDGFRYVDKTDLLIPLLNLEHETTFFLRPRRFGKTLTLSMIRRFVEDTRDERLNAENRELFRGLKIMEAGEKYTRQMTSYPVINLTLQSVKGGSFDVAFGMLQHIISNAYGEKSYLLSSPALNETEKAYFRSIRGQNAGNGSMLEEFLLSLKRLTEFLRKDSGKRAVVLIDEYDVPLEKADQDGYYSRMVGVIGPLLQNVLKTNSENLQFAVLTGCLHIDYSGQNNAEINTVLTWGKNDYIGFTEEEVRRLLTDSGVGKHFDQVQKMYDGYRFGDSKIYNPWSVIKFIEDLKASPDAPPLTYWGSTSGNDIIRKLAEKANGETRGKIEQLMQGEEICFPLQDNIVYSELYNNPDHMLNVMLFAGYLTATAFDGETIRARIPNLEVHEIYKWQIGDWFRESVKMFDVKALYTALTQGDSAKAEQILTDRFMAAINDYDTAEDFYRTVILTLMKLNQKYICTGNRESGNGRFGIVAKQRTRWELAFILESKVSDKVTDLLSDARKVAKKTTEKELQQEGYEKIMCYGISFCQKRCRVVQGETYTVHVLSGH